MRQIGGDQTLELRDQAVGTFGRQVDAKNFDGNETILLWLVSAKHGAKSTSTDLVKHAKRSEGIGRRSAGSIRVQWVLLEGRRSIVALKHTWFNRLAVLEYGSRVFGPGHYSCSSRLRWR